MASNDDFNPFVDEEENEDEIELLTLPHLDELPSLDELESSGALANIGSSQPAQDTSLENLRANPDDNVRDDSYDNSEDDFDLTSVLNSMDEEIVEAKESPIDEFDFSFALDDVNDVEASPANVPDFATALDDDFELPMDALPAVDEVIPQTSQLDDWDFDSFGLDDEETEPPSNDSSPATELNPFEQLPYDEEGWGFADEEEGNIQPSFSDDDDFSFLNNDEVEESPEENVIPEPTIVQDEDEDLSGYLSSFSENEENTDTPVDENNDGIADKLKRKFRKTLAEIKSDLRGGAEEEDQDEPEPEPNENANSQRRGGGIFSKIFKPYFWLTDLILNLLLKILGIFTFIPFLGPILKPFLTPNIFFKIIARILPLVLVVLVLYWHGARPLLPAKPLSFPDGGHAKISAFSYDSSKDEAIATVLNDGEVIANVTPTMFVYSIQPGLNPLSLFIPKENAKCMGEPIAVNIGEAKKIRVKCDVKGIPKKVTGELKW